MSEYAHHVAGAPSGHFTERGEVTIEGDARDVYLKVVGHTHIHAERAWLRWAAFHGQADSN